VPWLAVPDALREPPRGEVIGINWSNPITRGLQFAFTPAYSVQQALGTRPFALSNRQGAIYPSVIGPTYRTTGDTAGTCWVSELLPEAWKTAAASHLYVGLHTEEAGQGGFGRLVDVSANDTSTSPWVSSNLQFGNSTPHRLVMAYNRDGAYENTSPSIDIDVGVPYVGTGSRRDGETLVFYQGKLCGSNTLAGSIQYSSTSRVGIGIAGVISGDTQWVKSRCALAARWGRALAYGEHMALAANPWQILRFA
jgi:hypothetical protein